VDRGRIWVVAGCAQATIVIEECRALVFTGTEDFGIVPLEAMACGKPVIAFRRGGVQDTVQEGITGLFFDHPTPAALNEAVLQFEARELQFSPERIRAWADQFDEVRFRNAMQETIYAFEQNEARQLNRHGSAEKPGSSLRA
jgi:glycosyltransferase involved in cell wall biosynthesis